MFDTQEIFTKEFAIVISHLFTPTIDILLEKLPSLSVLGLNNCLFRVDQIK